MTIREILHSGLEAPQIIEMLKNKVISIPSWTGRLENEYYPSKHPVATDREYTEKYGLTR